MSAFKSYSQAGQDRFVQAVLDGKLNGTFVEIGCCHPIELSNTYALEQLFNWRGIGIDSSEDAVRLCREHRSPRSHFFCADATAFVWAAALARYDFPHIIDYASVDVDEATHHALRILLEGEAQFRILTVEHDAYSRGDRLRIPNRELMAAYGYDLLCADVHNQACAFEDWFVHPKFVDMDKAERFRCAGKEWTEILPV